MHKVEFYSKMNDFFIYIKKKPIKKIGFDLKRKKQISKMY